MVQGTDADRAQLLATLRIQYPDALADAGYSLLDPVSGEPFGTNERHLVATCRAVANFSMGTIANGPGWCLPAAEHGLEFLETGHRAADGDGYYLVVDGDGKPMDETRSAYAHAFVLLAYARAVQAGVTDATAGLEATHELLEKKFRDDRGLLRSDCDTDWNELEAYRGQNANMHGCEAYVAAYEATGEERYLDRARTIAAGITVELAAETDGLLWEHYTAQWDHDFGYNRDEPRHQFRPPGYQPGHHAEWAKLLGLLDRHETDPATRPSGLDTDGGWYSRAVELFDAAVDLGWTTDGFAYTVDRDGEILVPDRYGWAVAEGLGAAAVLRERAEVHDDEEAARRFDEWGDRLEAAADGYRGPAGLWYEKRLAAQEGGDPIPPEPPGVEPDYHPAGAFFECWRSAEDAAVVRDR